MTEIDSALKVVNFKFFKATAHIQKQISLQMDIHTWTWISFPILICYEDCIGRKINVLL